MTSHANRNQRATKNSSTASPAFNTPISENSRRLSRSYKRGQGKQQRNLDHLFRNGKRGGMVHRVNPVTGEPYQLNRLLSKSKPIDISTALRP